VLAKQKDEAPASTTRIATLEDNYRQVCVELTSIRAAQQEQAKELEDIRITLKAAAEGSTDYKNAIASLIAGFKNFSNDVSNFIKEEREER